MQITRNGLDTNPGPSNWFTGAVYLNTIAAPSNQSRTGAASVHFTPGARTAWHTHPHGQTIWVTEGVGLCQSDGGPIEVIRPWRPRLLRAGREPLARRRTDEVHDPHRDAAGKRRGRGRRLGRACQRRTVRRRAVDHGRSELMRAAVMYAPGDVRVEERDEPQIVEPTDAIIRVSAACVCGSDLWPYRGIGVEDVEWPAPMGHEYAGIVHDVGAQVGTIKLGEFA